MRPTSKRGHRSRGQGLVELALILPVMLLLLLGALDLGRVFYANIAITNAAKEAAFRASTGEDDWAAAAVNEASGGFVTVASGDVSTAFSDSTNKCSSSAAFGATVAATVTAPFLIITPFIGALLGGQNKTLTAMAQADCRVVPAMALLPEPAPTPCALVLVPAVNGLSAPTAANSAITGVGLTPTGIDDLTTGKKNEARNQSPVAGTCVALGSPVTYHYRP